MFLDVELLGSDKNYEEEPEEKEKDYETYRPYPISNRRKENHQREWEGKMGKTIIREGKFAAKSKFEMFF